MKYFFIGILLLTGLVSACGPRDRYVRVVQPSSQNTVQLPQKSKNGLPQFYSVNGVRYYPLPDSVGYSEIGNASWYGKKFHGRRTANGEFFDMHEKSGAHKTLPMGTYVRVINLDNHKYTVIRINDRGPFVKGRIIDLSYAAAKEIGLIGPGVARVKVTALGKEIRPAGPSSPSRTLVEVADLKSGDFSVQIGAFQDEKNANQMADRLKVIFEYVNVVRYADENNRIFYRVWVSKTGSLQEAAEMEKRLEDMGFVDAFVVRM